MLDHRETGFGKEEAARVARMHPEEQQHVVKELVVANVSSGCAVM